MAGRPKGAWSEKRFREALQAAVSEKDERGTTRLRLIAERLVEQALKGEGWAIQQVSDRIDGKVPQAIIGGEEDDPPVAVQFIELRAVRPNATPAD
jgi:hypothetical protein